MAVEVVSTTEAPKEASATAQPNGDDVVETKSASEQSARDENVEESETSEEGQSAGDDNENETNGDDEDKSSSDEIEKKGKGADKKIKKLVRKLSEKDQEIELWKKEAMKARGQSEADTNSKDSKVEAKPEVSDEPQPDQFDNHADYVKAVTKWALAEDKKEQARITKEQEVKSSYEKQQREFFNKVNEFKKTTEDYDDVIAEIEEVMLNPGIIETVITSDNGPQIMYELAKNQAELERINALSPLAASRELGKFLAKLESSSAQREEIKEIKKQTKAPPPIAPVGSKGISSMKKSLSDPSLSQREYEAIRRKQLAEKQAY